MLSVLLGMPGFVGMQAKSSHVLGSIPPPCRLVSQTCPPPCALTLRSWLLQRFKADFQRKQGTGVPVPIMVHEPFLRKK